MLQFGRYLMERFFTFLKEKAPNDTTNICGGVVLAIAILLLSRGKRRGTTNKENVPNDTTNISGGRIILAIAILLLSRGKGGGAANDTAIHIPLRKTKVHIIDTESGVFGFVDSTNPSTIFQDHQGIFKVQSLLIQKIANPSLAETIANPSPIEVVSPTEQVVVGTSGASYESSASMDSSQTDSDDLVGSMDFSKNESLVPSLRPNLATKIDLYKSLWEQYKALNHQIDEDIFSLISNRWPQFYGPVGYPVFFTNSVSNMDSSSESEDSEIPIPARPNYEGSADIFVSQLMEFYLSGLDTGNAIKQASLEAFEMELEDKLKDLSGVTLLVEGQDSLLSDYQNYLPKMRSKLCLEQFDLSIRKSKNRDFREARPVSEVPWKVEIARISTAISDLQRIRVVIERISQSIRENTILESLHSTKIGHDISKKG